MTGRFNETDINPPAELGRLADASDDYGTIQETHISEQNKFLSKKIRGIGDIVNTNKENSVWILKK